MYSPFNSSSRLAFVNQELTHEYLEFPVEIDDAYSEVMDWLSNLTGMHEFDATRNINLNSYQMPDTGRQFSQFLPAHTMKVYQTLLDIELQSINTGTTSILEQPNILIIDDGCGGGTATIALISLFINYQNFRLMTDLPLSPVSINCLGIDPNENALKIYGLFLEKCKTKIENLLIAVKDTRIFLGTLPNNTAPIIEWIAEQKRTHCIIVALSNIIRPLTQDYIKTSKLRSIFDEIGLGGLLPNRFGKDIGNEEITTLKAILNTHNVDQLIVLLIGALSNGKRKNWRDEMSAFQQAINTELKNAHFLYNDPIKSRSVKIINPLAGFYRKHRNFEKSGENEYDSGYLIIHNKDYLGDSDWHKILSQENLLLAWARVRNALSYDMLEDTIEMRLFEANIEERLAKLRSEIYNYQWDVLNIAEMLHFRVPKGLQKKPRPMSVCRIEDLILATAILQVKGKEYQITHHSRSYAYEFFARQKGEQLYKNWFIQHQKKFLADAREVARKYPSYCVIRTDISSYYTDIEQSKLFQRVERYMALYYSRGKDLIDKLINRDCSTGKNGYGIPQGHIMSGALANLYLTEVDQLFGPGNPWGIEYFRFVDDMIFILPPSVKPEFVLNKLDINLSSLGLTRSKDKTSSLMSTQEFLDLTAPDELLEELGKEHNFLLSELYKLDRNYIRISLKDWWPFVECYHKLLIGVGVYISVPRLSRKLQKNLRWIRRTFNWWYKLKMPEAKQLADLKHIDEWLSKFNQYHGSSPNGWIHRRKRHINRLLHLFSDSITKLDSDSEIERTRSSTRIKFVLNRLGQLGFGKVSNVVVDLLVEQPWLLHPRRICLDLALQNREDLLIKAFNHIHQHDGFEWEYIRGAILKSFSSLPLVSENGIALLHHTMFNGKSILERTMASEAMLLLQQTKNITEEELIITFNETEDNYLLKNYILLHAATPNNNHIPTISLTQGRIVNEAIEYTRVTPDLNQLFRYEPEILREEFYEGDYPDDPEEFEDFPY